MIKNISKIFIAIFVVILVIGGAVLIYKNKSADDFGGQTQPSPTPIGAEVSPSAEEKNQILAELKSAAEKEDYPTFADLLKKVYDNGWEKEKDFEKVESEAYMKVDKDYFMVENYDKAFEISTIVYDKAPSGWRFAYLRIITLEKTGRMALEKNDLAGAEEKALTILKMTFRLEGTNLLADVYIKKIEADIAAKNKVQATADYNYIKDFETSQDRRDKLNSLFVKINNL